MRYCVNGRQQYSVLKRADEIKVAFNDKDKILDFVEKIPEAIVILDVPGNEEDWELWSMYSEVFTEFHIALHNLYRVNEFNEAGIKWYWPYPITSYYELCHIVKLNPSYLMIGPPLSFDLPKVQTMINTLSESPIPVRMVANVAHPAYLPGDNDEKFGLRGQWVRPEDVVHYEPYVQCLEFDEVKLSEEEVMLKVYKEDQNWPGNLYFLIRKLNYHVDNRAIPDELGPARVKCGQKCFSGSPCRLCVSTFRFADAIRKESYRRRQEAKIDNN
jgi:hypothetical protein